MHVAMVLILLYALVVTTNHCHSITYVVTEVDISGMVAGSWNYIVNA